MTLSELISAGLREKKISQAKFAKEVGISRVQMNHYANGKAVPKLIVALRISRSLGFSLDKMDMG